jgi:hypothetical protein
MKNARSECCGRFVNDLTISDFSLLAHKAASRAPNNWSGR